MPRQPRNQRAEWRVGAPYASDAPSQSMVGSLRSWLEKSRNEPTHPHRWRTLSRRRAPPTAASSPSQPGSRRPSARSSQRWLLPLRRRQVLPRSAWAGRPRPQSYRPLPRLSRSDRSAGRARTQPRLRPPKRLSEGRASPPPPPPNGRSAGRPSPQRRRLQPSGRSAGLAKLQQRPHLPNDRSDGPGRVPSPTPDRHLAGSTVAVRWGVRRSPDPNPDPLGQVSTGFG